jgi:hypothetical protein
MDEWNAIEKRQAETREALRDALMTAIPNLSADASDKLISRFEAFIDARDAAPVFN